MSFKDTFTSYINYDLLLKNTTKTSKTSIIYKKSTSVFLDKIIIKIQLKPCKSLRSLGVFKSYLLLFLITGQMPQVIKSVDSKGFFIPIILVTLRRQRLYSFVDYFFYVVSNEIFKKEIQLNAKLSVKGELSLFINDISIFPFLPEMFFYNFNESLSIILFPNKNFIEIDTLNLNLKDKFKYFSCFYSVLNFKLENLIINEKNNK